MMLIKIVIVFFCIGFTIYVSNSDYSNALANPLSSNLPFIGKITEVGSNYTIQIDNITDVRLAFLDTRMKDPQILDDATHFMSVLCPIRSPALVYPNLTFILLNSWTVAKNEISALVYCQNFDNHSNKHSMSLNEQLVKANLAVFDKDACLIHKFTDLRWALLEIC
ncbi:MAG: hypothetical protein L0H55_09850 [Candidatus Nitrosocosmicus sp.]|nr:hypothetical protein [Candidatus Nitrosocosmicus sp.]